MSRRYWRRNRSSENPDLCYNATRSLAVCLGNSREFDAANQLLDEASNYASNGTQRLELKLFRASLLVRKGESLEALGLLQAILPEAKVYTPYPDLCGRTMYEIAQLLLQLERYQEAYEAAAELVAFAKAKLGLEDRVTLQAVATYADACAKLGRIEEAKANFDDTLTTQTRVLGREHPQTQHTLLMHMRFHGFTEPSG